MNGQVCQCGCGESVSDSSFKPGHDQRLRIDLERRAGGIEGLRSLVEGFEKNNSSEQARIDECTKEIDDVFKRIGDDQSEYDKQLLALSSGFLAVSLAFIKDVVPLKDAVFLYLLYSSFALLAACIMLVLFSYQFSISGQLKAKEYWENKKNTGKEEAFPYGHATCIKWLNRVSGVLFGIGVLSIVFFVILNISEAKMGNNRGIAQDGALIKTPSNGGERGSLIKAPPKPAPAQSNTSGNNQPKKP